ncbi:MAG: hypothetical protein PXY39_11170 [archaeon]|nr:hypothetical protein [archaeon]
MISFFARIGDKSQAASRSSTVFINADKKRAHASQAFPAELNPELATPAQPFASQVQSQTTVPPSHPPFFYQGEQVLWKRTFSKGIMHWEAAFTEVITNLRAFVIDDPLKSIVRAVLSEDRLLA